MSAPQADAEEAYDRADALDRIAILSVSIRLFWRAHPDVVEQLDQLDAARADLRTVLNRARSEIIKGKRAPLPRTDTRED
ncbi:MAG: hypothetical protein AAGI34_10295 [Pseudomonadota bacterium]